MHSSEWTPERLRCRIQDHLRWVAIAQDSAAPTPRGTFVAQSWPWLKMAIRTSALSVPVVGPVFLTFLRRVKARLRRKDFTSVQ